MRNLKKTHSSIKKKVKIAKYSILENKKLDIPHVIIFLIRRRDTHVSVDSTGVTLYTFYRKHWLIYFLKYVSLFTFSFQQNFHAYLKKNKNKSQFSTTVVFLLQGYPPKINIDLLCVIK